MLFKVGNIILEDVEAIVNPVNCVGVMSKGLALQFKNAFKDNFLAYVKACKRGEVQPGRMFVFETGLKVNPRYIINFPTKYHWKENSFIEDIDSGLNSLVQEIDVRKIKSIAIPPLGCGLGGLKWSKVHPIIKRILNKLVDVKIIIFEPL